MCGVPAHAVDRARVPLQLQQQLFAVAVPHIHLSRNEVQADTR